MSSSPEDRLRREQANHAQAFQALAASFDRIAEDLAAAREREAQRLFRDKARWWFRRTA